MQARKLLARAQELYDHPELPFAQVAAAEGWRTAFSSGADWMRLVMSHLRGTPIPSTRARYNILGIFKYGLASVGALTYIGFVIWLQWWILLPGFIVVFYIIEAQMVFLFQRL